MSLSSNLWTGTGLIHCLIGLAIPELRDPLLRIVADGAVEISAATLEERYARAAAVWFQLFGVAVVLQGLTWKQHVRLVKAPELPSWWGWSVTAIGLGLGKIMPHSGWPLVLGQGVRIVWRNRHRHHNNEGKKQQ